MILQPVKTLDTGYLDKRQAMRLVADLPRDRIRLTLKCGHVLSRKASQRIPERARCRDCENAK